MQNRNLVATMFAAAILLVVLGIGLLFLVPVLVNAWLGWTFGLAPLPYWKLFWGMVLARVVLGTTQSSLKFKGTSS